MVFDDDECCFAYCWFLTIVIMSEICCCYKDTDSDPYVMMM